MAQTGELVFESGEDMHNIVIQIIDDDIHEKDEDFFVDLRNPTSTGKSAQLPARCRSASPCPSLR